MSEARRDKMPISAAMSELYGYIYCMLLSNDLVGVPFFGGALYLFGRSVAVCSTLLSSRQRKYLSVPGRRFVLFIAVLLFALTTALFGLYPTSIESSRLWALYAAVALCLLADGVTQRVVRVSAGKRGRGRRLLGVLLQIAIIAAAGIILVNTLEDGWPLFGGFALLVLFRARTVRVEGDALPDVSPGEAETDIRSVQAYRAYHWISIMLFAFVDLVIGVIYALLATRTEWLLPSILIGVAVTLVFTEMALFFLRHTRKPGRRDPTRLLLVGLVLCAGGAVFCVWMLRAGQVDYLRVYCCLGAVSAGGALSMAGLFRINQLMADVMNLVGHGSTGNFGKTRIVDLKLARLAGDTLALLILTVICFVNRDSLPRDMASLAARFQPVMAIPVLLVAIGAFLSVIHFPLSDRYIDRLASFLQLRDSGEENPVMREKLERVVSGALGQPFLTRFLSSLLRPLFRYRLEGEEKIVPDVRNPILFLGNHLEVLGPILATLWFPVPVRFWSISHMMDDRKKVTEYVYTNTFSKVTWLPVFMRRLIASFIGWLSVKVLDQLECIPVYRDSPMKLRETVRRSIEALESGDNLMIFPESSHEKYAIQGIGRLSPGFVMLAAAYWRKTGKRLRMMPVYASKEKKTIFFGDIFQYNPDAAFAQEQDRILWETERQIFAMAGIPQEEEKEDAP